MSTVRSEKYELTAGMTRTIKIVDNEAPVRFIVSSGSFTYEHRIKDSVITTGTAIASGVVAAPGNAWGSELQITCVTDGTLYVAWMG